MEISSVYKNAGIHVLGYEVNVKKLGEIEAVTKGHLAHPVAYEMQNGLNEDDVEKIVTELEADGIEAEYLYIDKNGNLTDNIDRWRRFAVKNRLFVTGGSDFHRDDGKHPLIGKMDKNV